MVSDQRPFKVRRLLRVFPVYLVDTRDILLYEWSELWDVVCDIVTSGIEQDSDLVKNFTNVFRINLEKIVLLIIQRRSVKML